MIDTIIIDSSINRIIALSDIHSDIHAFIICLRDCAKVIRKVQTSKSINIHKLDSDTEDFLEMNLNNTENLYMDNLNYEWIGGNTNIVICGDILDGARDNSTMMRKGKNRCGHNNCTNLEYDQVEIKLLRFINSMNQLAMQSGGRIYKILGNHDFMNLANNTEYIRLYIPTYTKNEPNYYKGFTRLEYFNAGNPGSQLLLQDGAYLCLIINNNIFVHGQLDNNKSVNDYIFINNQINNITNNNINNKIWTNLANKELNITSFGRTYDRFASNIRNNHRMQFEKCKNVKNVLTKFHHQIKNYIPNYQFMPLDLRVIIGHCPQLMGNKETPDNILIPPGSELINSTFVNKQIDGNIEILSGPTIKTGIQNLDLLFGIGMECNKNNLDNFNTYPELAQVQDNDERYIYKVDVGSMRGFDLTADQMPIKDQNVKLELGQRTPQVLEINGKNNIKIIRSTILNTRIHQPRAAWETRLNNTENKLPTFNIDSIVPDSLKSQDTIFTSLWYTLFGDNEKSENSNLDYKNKYLKYKYKYLVLQKKFNNTKKV